MSLVGITSSPLSLWRQGACVCLSVVAGHGLLGTVAVWGSGTVILAMYTFIVGPWLPASSAISADLIHKPAMKVRTYLIQALSVNFIWCAEYLYLQSRPTHLLLLCLLLHSSKLQKCLLSPCSYGLKHQSVEIRAISDEEFRSSCILGILWIGRIRAPLVLPVCSRCGHICQKSRWLDGVRQGWRPRCTLAPGVWLVCGCRCLDLHPKAEQWSQRKH